MAYVLNRNNSSKFDVLVESPWVSVREIARVVREMSRLNVAYAVELRSAWQLWAGLYLQAPFDINRRFSDVGSFVCLTSADWTNKESTLRSNMSAIATILNVDLGRNAAQQGQQQRPQDQQQMSEAARQALGNAIRAFSEMLRNISNQLVNLEGVYNQYSFEAQYNFVWDHAAVPRAPGVVAWRDVAGMMSFDPTMLFVGNTHERAITAAWPNLANVVTLNNANFNLPVGAFYIWGNERVGNHRVRIRIVRAGNAMQVTGLRPAPTND